MSFSAEQKQEIIEHVYKSSCCRRAMLCGVLFARAALRDGKIIVRLEKADYAEYVAKLIREFYGKDAEIFRSSNGGRTIMLSFNSQSAEKYIAKIDAITEMEEFSVCDILTQKCASCLPSFLRGVFLAAGRLSDPKKQFFLEFSMGSRTDHFKKILKDLEMNPLHSKRTAGETLYFRRGDDIETFYGHAGLNRVVFDIIETKIKTLARRESQRYLNCVTSNYDRMTAVSERQIGIISRLDELQLLSSLPDELEETARLKLRYPDLPLSALAAQMIPAISKSGLSHRLKKIEEVGARLLNLSEET